MFSYVLHIISFQLLFLLVYEVMLKKETFFTWNRWYLLLTSVISLLLPLIHIEALSSVISSESLSSLNPTVLPEVILGETSQSLSNLNVPSGGSNFRINWWLIIYVTGLAGSFLLFLKKYKELSRLFRFRTVSLEGDLRIIDVPNSSIACTFYNTVFLGEKLSEAEKQHILPHELVHVKQKHSLDLLFFEFNKIIFWFNPLIYIYQARIATLHEFIADAEVMEQKGKRSYYEQLLNTAFSTTNISFSNQFFNHSLIKNRIIMIQKSRSKAIARLKYLVLAPLMLLMLTTVAYSGTGDNNHINIPEVAGEKTGTDMPQDPKLQETAIPFAVVEEAPVYPGCNQQDTAARKECLVENIKDHVNRNFNLSAVQPYMASGINRIVVQFQIDRNGKVTAVRSRMVSPGPDREAKAFMEEEANRVVANLPEMKPARHEGKEVGVMYSLPIQFFAPGDEG